MISAWILLVGSLLSVFQVWMWCYNGVPAGQSQKLVIPQLTFYLLLSAISLLEILEII